MASGELIKNVARVKQTLDFKGLDFGGGRYPTDIDGCIDWGGQKFVFLEAKYAGAPLPIGQRICLENLCNKSTADSIVMVVEHTQRDLSKPIECANLLVPRVYYQGIWTDLTTRFTVRESVDDFLNSSPVPIPHYCPHCGSKLP